MYPDIVFAQSHLGAALLGAADRNNDDGCAGPDGISRFGPSQIIELHLTRRSMGASRKSQGENSNASAALKRQKQRWFISFGAAAAQ